MREMLVPIGELHSVVGTRLHVQYLQEQRNVLRVANSEKRIRPKMAPQQGKRDNVVLLILLVASLSLNVYLGVKVKEFEGQPLNAPSSSQLPIGIPIPPLSLTNMQGEKETVTFAGSEKPTVIYVFKPLCSWCDRNLANIKALALSQAQSHRFIGISLSNELLREYVEVHKLNFPVYTDLPPKLARTLGLGSTPHTLIVSTDGKLTSNWIGAYGGPLEKQVQDYFNVVLPGVAAEGRIAQTPP